MLKDTQKMFQSDRARLKSSGTGLNRDRKILEHSVLSKKRLGQLKYLVVICIFPYNRHFPSVPEENEFF